MWSCCSLKVLLLITLLDCGALLCRPHEQEFQLEELSDLLSDGTLTLPCPDNFLSSLLFFPAQSSFFLFFFFFPFLRVLPIPSLCLLFFNLIMESSTSQSKQQCWLLVKESFSASMCQSAGIGALVESIWHGGVELYYCEPGNMKCSSVRQKW